MPVFSDGQKISAALVYDRLIQSMPATYVVWKDGSTYRAECLVKGGTDYSGTDATTVIQAALDGLTAARTWKEKVLLKGSLSASSTITIPSYVKFELDGILTLANGANQPLIQNSDASGGNTDIEFLGGIYDLNGANQTAGNAFTLVRVHDSVMNGVTVKNGYNWCLNWETNAGAGATYAKNNRVLNCRFEQSGLNAATAKDLAVFGRFTDSLIEGCLFIGNSTWTAYGLSTRNMKNTKIIGCFATDCNYGYGIENSEDVEFTSCNAVGNNACGIIVKYVDANPTNIKVIGGYFENYAAGYTTDTSNIIFNKVTNGQVIGATVVGGGEHGINIGESARVLVQGCIAYNNNERDLTTGVGIRLNQCNNSRVVDCISYDDRTPKQQRYGIRVIHASSDKVWVLDNDVEDNLTANILKEGTNITIKNNKGYVTENSGITTAIATGATVTHGLAGTPTKVIVTAAESGPTDIYVSSVGATTFAINYGGGGTKTFYWEAEYKP